jgi:methyl-accepting chemotaxis protein
VTREENYALRAAPWQQRDEIGSLAEAFNTMLSRIEATRSSSSSAHVTRLSGQAYDQAQSLG